jgi:hypothetical protein
MRGYRRRYMIVWASQGMIGRETWIMDRDGKLSSEDIDRIQGHIAEKRSLDKPVLITNVELLN